MNAQLKSLKNENKFGKISTHKLYLRIVAISLATEAFKEGETGVSPKNTSKREVVTFSDSILASTLDGSPSDETEN